MRPQSSTPMWPREYLDNPHAFGRRADVRCHVPPGGDAVSAGRHVFSTNWCSFWRAARPRRVGARDARVFGITSSTWSSSVLGERWMGETVMAAVLHALSHRERMARVRRELAVGDLPVPVGGEQHLDGSSVTTLDERPQ